MHEHHTAFLLDATEIFMTPLPATEIFHMNNPLPPFCNRNIPHAQPASIPHPAHTTLGQTKALAYDRAIALLLTVTIRWQLDASHIRKAS